MIEYLINRHAISERKACQLVGLSRSSYDYQHKLKNDTTLRQRLKHLAIQYPAYGYRLLHHLLKQEGLVVNKKRTCCLYTQENLQVRTKRRKKLQRPRQSLKIPATLINVGQWILSVIN